MPKQDISIPLHLGLILDGNRRWAKEQGLPQFEGHKHGYQTLKTIGLAALDRGVAYISAYLFSTENWERSKTEVDYLMKLLLWVFKHEIDEFNKRNIRIRVLGSRERLSKSVLNAIDRAEEITKNNTGGTLALCLNYGGQLEIVDAVKKIVEKGVKKDNITPVTIEQNLYSADIPPIDLIIRTSGEKRLSNFMLWRAAYSELMFVDTYWPAFTERDLDDCFKEYATRQRRFGS
jgi:undecaprenyl diphosphate synthase